MKKFIIALTAVVIPAVSQANWSETQSKEYMKIMFTQAMKYERYSEVLDIPETISMLKCVETFYKENYNFDQFLEMYYNGDNAVVEEFHQVEEFCINVVVTDRQPKHYY